MKKLLTTVALVAVGLNAYAGCEKPGYERTASNERFVVRSEGTVLDVVNGLEWQRCSYPQAFNVESGLCVAEKAGLEPARVSWSDALLYAEQVRNETGDASWRLPNIKELGSIVERGCGDPAINVDVFLNTPSGSYWSSTNTAGYSPQQMPAHYINFLDGTERDATIYKDGVVHSATAFVRLVKDSK